MLTAGKGSPGVTTTAVALAAVWPRPVLLAECDLAGGDLPALLPGVSGAVLTATRGVVSLAAAARTQPHPSLDDHVQLVAGGLPVLAGPESAAQAAALAPSWPSVVDALAGLEDVDVIVDCGRYTSDDATRRLIAAADRTLVVCRATVTSVAHAREVLVALGRRGDGSRPPDAPVAVVVIGDQNDAREVAGALAAHTPASVGGLEYDPPAAEGLCGAWSRRLDRSRLVAGARVLARQVDQTLAADVRVHKPPQLANLPVSHRTAPTPAGVVR